MRTVGGQASEGQAVYLRSAERAGNPSGNRDHSRMKPKKTARCDGGESMKYSLYDTYETEIEPGELLCTSDDYAEIVEAAKLRKAETDGECELYVMERVGNETSSL